MPWSKIGGPAHSLAVYGGRLAALTPDRQAVFTRNPRTGDWSQIGGPAEALIGGGWDLYATSPGGGGVFRFNGVGWSAVGGPGAQFTGVCNALYALSPNRDRLLRYNRLANDWTVIGPSPAGNIVEGGSRIWASTPGDAAIWAWARYDGSWRRIGGAGAEWVGVGARIYGLTPDRQAVYEYDERADRWNRVGGPAQTLIGGGNHLCAVEPGTGDIWRYFREGTRWERIGGPGAQFVAADEFVYGLTPDRQEVWLFEDDLAETSRIRAFMLRCYDHPEYGLSVRRGFLVKHASGRVLAEHAADTCFQPLSVLKLLPYLHALIDVDRDPNTSMSTRVSWFETAGASGAARTDTVCLTAGPGTVSGSAPLTDALPTMMWESHNRSLDAVMDLFGTTTITRRAQQELGFSQTEMYPGCPTATRPWADNIITLQDMARLYEGVDAMHFFDFGISRRLFEGNMIVADDSDPTYSSPITGRDSGPASASDLLSVLEEEALSAGKSGIVQNFMQSVVLRRKGGSGGPSGDDVGYADAAELSLPFRRGGGRPVIEKYVLGWFLNQIRDPERDIPPDADLLMLDINDNWSVVGGPGSQWVGIGATAYGLTPDRQAVFRHDGPAGQWTQIGGPAETLIDGGHDLYAIEPGTSDIWRFTGAPMTWERIGGPGAAFAGVGATVYGISPSGNRLFRWNGTPNDWTRVRDNVVSIIGGGDEAYAIDGSTGDILSHDASANSWKRIGGPGIGFVAGQGGLLFGMTTDRQEVWSYNGTPNSWARIGNAADSLAVAGGRLYGLTPGKGAIFRYDGMPLSWTKVGDAVGSMIGGSRLLYASSSPVTTRSAFARELYRGPIQEALATW
ncbi:serine hydrolase [Ruegeria lacuscaerulensis]|uniref:serine hydrolase n=1 Tax=Ruegeria lacuscaerulensis TaxID=55218 RepID=UPI00148025D1|nr:serine hydrolase [Ruegeria lacuscaerulensis]